MNALDRALARRVAERDSDEAEAVIPGNELERECVGWDEGSDRALSLPEVWVALLPGEPTHRHVLWRCLECGHPHLWRWRTWDIPYGEVMAMDCDHCSYRQRMRFPASVPSADQCPGPSPDPSSSQRPDPRWAGGFEQWLQTKPAASAAKPIIQDGQRLAAVAATIAERLMDRNWVQLRMDSSEHATDLIEIAAALREFGA